MRNVALVINTDKPLAVDAASGIVAWLEARAFQPVLQPAGGDALGRPDLSRPMGADWGAGAEMVIVLGGDGTLIGAAKAAAPLRVPVLGINTGHLGFLTELENAEVYDHLDELLAGHGILEERLMLTARLERPGADPIELTAVNEAFVGKGPRTRLVHMAVSIGETVVARYHADGLVIATPTGSTAYSLSAGGPIVAPGVDAMLLTPVCPHTMSARPMVVAGHEEVTITLLEGAGEVGLSVDGADLVPVRSGDVVRVVRAPYTARLVRRHPNRFYDILQQKLADSGR